MREATVKGSNYTAPRRTSVWRGAFRVQKVRS